MSFFIISWIPWIGSLSCGVVGNGGSACNGCCSVSVKENATSPWTAYRCIYFFNWHMSDPESITVIGVINKNGVQYYCSQYNKCKFTAEDNSEHYIFFHVKKNGTCQVSLIEVSTGS